MLFSQSTYIGRRASLRSQIDEGIILLFGNNLAPINYPNNCYTMRQDSSFLYFYGQHRDGLVGAIDTQTGTEWLFGDDIDIDDIVWSGSVTSVAAMASECGVERSAPLAELADLVDEATKQGRTIHFLPPYRFDTQIRLMDLLHIHPSHLAQRASLPLIKAVVNLRSTKSDDEIKELERAGTIGYKMHTTARELCRPGVTEQYISGVLNGIASSYGTITSFQNIVTQHGEIMHGAPTTAPLEEGRLLLVDAGAETNENYCSDNTRVTPVSGRFTPCQRDIYQIVSDCHDLAMQQARPGVRYMDIHLNVCRLMAERLKTLGLMKGNTDDAVEAGAHALFLPHGLGHMMGLDVHDMEDLGQIHVGFDTETRPRLDQFGTNALRMGRRLEKGFVVTDEPGIYFIPQLIDDWRARGLHTDFLCYDKIEAYKDFGGIRIEDDLLITDTGCRIVGKDVIPYHIADIEK